ncbi:antirestriction protein ArdA [Bacillus spizizenii]|nr:antirestriction protein ArdA [Bacillus spizizenii]
MTEIKIWVGNLGKYNEGDLVGEWFTLPADMEEIEEAIGLNEEYEEYYIADFEAPFTIGQHDCIDSLNEIAERIDGMEDYEIEAAAELVGIGAVADFEDGLNEVEDGRVYFYHDCNTMEEVAMEIINETGMLDEVPDKVAMYFDYEAYARDLQIESTFLELSRSVWMQYIK